MALLACPHCAFCIMNLTLKFKPYTMQQSSPYQANLKPFAFLWISLPQIAILITEMCSQENANFLLFLSFFSFHLFYPLIKKVGKVKNKENGGGGSQWGENLPHKFTMLDNFMGGDTEAQRGMPTITQLSGDLTVSFPLWAHCSLAAFPGPLFDEALNPNGEMDPIANKGKAKAKISVSS